jgi:nicotinamide-nucleotide amidase
MKVSIISIGDELLIGQVVNTNASWMSQLLVSNGMNVDKVYTISDKRADIEETLSLSLKGSDAVIITGGLGPTKDDVTKKTLCDFFNSELVEDSATFEVISDIFAKRGYPMTDTNRQQALVPKCSKVLLNKRGTAPGMWFEVGAKVVVSLPGVPFEMQYLMNEEVVPRMLEHFMVEHIIHKNLLFQGIGESFLSDRIENWELALPQNIKLAYLPKAGLLRLRLTAIGADKEVLMAKIDELVKELYSMVGEYILGEDMENLAEVLAYKMKTEGKTLAVAESCSGGAIASSITQKAGASKYFKGGVVAYSNAVKENVLGVKSSTLAEHGAVSEETATEMVRGVLKLMDADYAIATTGIAGPGGGTPEKPVGTVWIAVASKDEVFAQKMTFGDDRLRVIERTANQAFANMLKLITKKLC